MAEELDCRECPINKEVLIVNKESDVHAKDAALVLVKRVKQVHAALLMALFPRSVEQIVVSVGTVAGVNRHPKCHIAIILIGRRREHVVTQNVQNPNMGYDHHI